MIFCIDRNNEQILLISFSNTAVFLSLKDSYERNVLRKTDKLFGIAALKADEFCSCQFK